MPVPVEEQFAPGTYGHAGELTAQEAALAEGDQIIFIGADDHVEKVVTYSGSQLSTVNEMGAPVANTSPQIFGFSPGSGGPGTSGYITGVGFSGYGRTLTLNGVAIPFVVQSDTFITWGPLPDNIGGNGLFRFTSNLGWCDSVDVFYWVPPPPPAPYISSLAPSSGSQGTTGYITGGGFYGNARNLTLNGVAIPFTVVADNYISWGPLPSGLASGWFTFQSDRGTAVSPIFFTWVVTPPPPPPPPPSTVKIYSFSPGSGGPGTVGYITGIGFLGTGRTLTINGVAIPFVVQSDEFITWGPIPANVTTGRFKFYSNERGIAYSSYDFIFTTNVTTPFISSFTPGSGPVGTAISINGYNFGGTTPKLYMYGDQGVIDIPFGIHNGGTLILATIPSAAITGKLYFSSSWGTTQSAADFVVTDRNPEVTQRPVIGLTRPDPLPQQHVLTIKGAHFNGASYVLHRRPDGTVETVPTTRWTTIDNNTIQVKGSATDTFPVGKNQIGVGKTGIGGDWQDIQVAEFNPKLTVLAKAPVYSGGYLLAPRLIIGTSPAAVSARALGWLGASFAAGYDLGTFLGLRYRDRTYNGPPQQFEEPMPTTDYEPAKEGKPHPHGYRNQGIVKAKWVHDGSDRILSAPFDILTAVQTDALPKEDEISDQGDMRLWVSGPKFVRNLSEIYTCAQIYVVGGGQIISATMTSTMKAGTTTVAFGEHSFNRNDGWTCGKSNELVVYRQAFPAEGFSPLWTAVVTATGMYTDSQGRLKSFNFATTRAGHPDTVGAAFQGTAGNSINSCKPLPKFAR